MTITKDRVQKAVEKVIPVTRKEIDVKLDKLTKPQDAFTDMKKVDTFTMTKEEALGKIAMMLAKTEEEKILTDLSDRTINQLSILVGLSEQLHLKTYENICNTYMRLRVSNKRMGRKELLEIARAVKEEPEAKMGRLRRFLGGIF